MSSEDFPRAQDSSHSDPVGGPAAQQPAAPPEPGANRYPQVQYNTGEYRSTPPAAPTYPDSPSGGITDGSPGTADMGPAAHSTVASGSQPGRAEDLNADSQDTGPVHQATAVWQPRPSGALAAEAWSSPSSTAVYPSTGAGTYGTGQYRSHNAYAQPGQPYPGDPSNVPYGAAPTGAQGYLGAPTALGYGGSPQSAGGQGGLGPVAGGQATVAPRKSRRTATVIAVTALALVAGFGGGLITRTWDDNQAVTDNSLSQQISSPVVSNTQPIVAGSVESVAAKLLPSVVSILSISSSEEAEGSGVILSSDGLILTNNHVITGATDLTVKFNDGTTSTAKVIGSDSTDDLAVIKVSGVSGLTKATLGSSANVKVGEQVVAVGSPLGLSATVTSGIVSALNRPVRTASEDSQTQQQQGQGQQGQTQAPTTTAQDTVLNAIQTDAAINPGNSGGALVDMTGAVIGINSAIASLSSGSSSAQSGSIGVGFAIPIDQAHRIAQEIINTGHANHAVLGASVGDAPDASSPNAAQAVQAGLSVGAKIAALTEGGGASAAGLAAGDVITKIGSTPVGSADALIATIRSSNPGSQVTVTYLRGSATKTATVTLGSAVSN